ncbi:hypothetical protein, partial [Tessaracoccus sp. ZS01]|uniref:hypothetical protein n=1 Tax=Tessaracoccus sp. ZS01 TaxID=1906324 RepID=UPI000979C6DC
MTWRPLCTALIALFTFALMIPTASARPQDGHLTDSGHMVALPGTGTNWYGAYHVDRQTAYCADLMADGPRNASSWVQAPAGYVLRKQNRASHGTHGNGSAAATDRELAELAWVLMATGQQPAPDIGAAVEHFVRLRTIDGAHQQAREEQRWGAVVTAHPGARAQFDRLEREARLYAGPYTLEFNWQVRPSRKSPTGHVIVAVRSAAGVAVPHRAFSVAGSGNLQIVEAPTSTGEGGGAHVRVSLPSPEESTVRGTLSVQVRGLPGARPKLYLPQPATVQRLLAAPDLVKLNDSVSVELKPEVFHPTLTTRTRDVIAHSGAPAVDIVTLTKGRPGAEFTGTSALYGPFASLAELKASSRSDAPLVDTATFSGSYDAHGDAEVATTELRFPEAGYYTWAESLDARPTVVPPAPPAWPQLPETSVVLNPSVTSVLTADGAREPAEVGTVLADRIDLGGIPPGLEVPGSDEPLSVSVSGRIAGPVAAVRTAAGDSCEAADWTDAATLVEYEDTAWTGESLDGLARSTPTTPGCYSAEATVTIRHGTATVGTSRHPLGVPEQTILVTPAPRPTPE